MDRYEMNPDRIPALLEARGWLDHGDRRRESIHRALMAFQQWWGLTVDGWAGPVTERVLEAPRFCALPDRLELGGRRCAWPKDHLVTWTIAGSIPGFGSSDLKDHYAAAWQWWMDVCGLKAEYTSNEKTAWVLMGSGAIDGPSGTLGWSELPCGGLRQLKQKYDTREPWGVFDVNQNSPGKIDLLRVVCHEVGHVIGIDHLSDGALMAPTYDRRIRKPQREDIREAVSRYGDPERIAPPPAPPAPAMPSVVALTANCVIDGVSYGGVVQLRKT